MNPDNDNDDRTDPIQYQDSQGRWYELSSPTADVLAGQEHEMNQISDDEFQIGNFHMSSTQLFEDLETASDDKEQCSPHGFSPPPLRQHGRKKKCRGNRREQHIRRRARQRNSVKSAMETNQASGNDEQVQVSSDCWKHHHASDMGRLCLTLPRTAHAMTSSSINENQQSVNARHSTTAPRY